jgi:uroporphyrinogen decarboxylase
MLQQVGRRSQMALSSRERVLCALDHEEPDRVPLFMGANSPTTVLSAGYEKLKAHLGIQGGSTRLFSKAFQYAWMDEEVMLRLGGDGRPVVPGPAESTLRKDISDDCLVDDWGITWRRSANSLYYEVANSPLKKATLDNFERYPWPNLAAPSRFVGMADAARKVQGAGYASVLLSAVSIFELPELLRGLDTLLMDMAADEEFFTALVTKVKGLMIPYIRAMLKEVGPWIDLFAFSDDLGMTAGPLMSPATYRRLVKPHHAEVVQTIKENTSAKVFFHSCGNVYPLLGDVIDVGVDVLNPIQVSAGDMADTARLKREFGRRLSFCGGIDTRWVMPHGTPDQVRAEVRRRINDLAPGGGYVAAAVHCIQPDVPPENIVAMCEEVHAAGRYPIATN